MKRSWTQLGPRGRRRRGQRWPWSRRAAARASGSDSARRPGHPEDQLLGRLRPRRAQGQVRGREPERQDRPQLGRVQRPARGPAEEARSPAPARRTSPRSTRASSSSSAARPTSSSTCWTRAPARTRASTCPGSGSSRCRPTARPRSASAPTSAAWPCATAPTCSRPPACPPSATQVSALWPTWDEFIEVGQKYTGRDRSKKFVDTGTNLFNPILGQQPVGFYDESARR